MHITSSDSDSDSDFDSDSDSDDDITMDSDSDSDDDITMGAAAGPNSGFLRSLLVSLSLDAFSLALFFLIFASDFLIRARPSTDCQYFL